MCGSTVKLYIDTTVAWIRRYIKHSPHSNRPDVKRHLPFYSACQAVFYVFVYRHEDILHTYGECCSSPFSCLVVVLMMYSYRLFLLVLCIVPGCEAKTLVTFSSVLQLCHRMALHLLK